MHVYPAAVCWAARWHTSGPLAARLAADAAARERWEAGGVRDLVLLPMIPYTLWSVAYYLKAGGAWVGWSGWGGKE